MRKELEKAVTHVFDRAKEMGDMYEYECPHITKKLKEDIALVEQAIGELEELKRLNEPMKPNYSGKFPQCHNCGTLLHTIWQKHCHHCGQAIDWSYEK